MSLREVIDRYLVRVTYMEDIDALGSKNLRGMASPVTFQYSQLKSETNSQRTRALAVCCCVYYWIHEHTNFPFWFRLLLTSMFCDSVFCVILIKEYFGDTKHYLTELVSHELWSPDAGLRFRGGPPKVHAYLHHIYFYSFSWDNEINSL